jgi:MFS family permease
MHEIAARRGLPFHYGWVVVATGTLSIFAALGLGRFALGMLLPSMAASLSLSYDQMGYLGTGNFIGYLAAVLVCGRLAGRFGARRMIASGLLLVGASMVLVAQAGGYGLILLLYVATGFGSATANVPVMGLVSHWFARRHRGKAAGFIVIGSGFAIVFSGLVIPALNAGAGDEGWRLGWGLIGTLSVAAGLTAALLLRDHPGEIGLTPVGAADAAAHADIKSPSGEPAAPRHIVGHLGAIYSLFGFGYVIYATFIVTTLVQERGFSEAAAGQVWAWIGLLSLFSGPGLGILSDRFGRKAALMTVFTCQAAAYLLVALPVPEPLVYLSVALYGLVAWSVPGIMAAAVGDYLGPNRAVAAFGTVTLFFGVGQICGPALAGVLAKSAGGFAPSYWTAALSAVVALALSARLPRPA